MSVGAGLRFKNKHIKVVLIPIYDESGYSVDRVTNTLDPKPGSLISEAEAEKLLDKGYTVIVKTLNSKSG